MWSTLTVTLWNPWCNWILITQWLQCDGEQHKWTQTSGSLKGNRNWQLWWRTTEMASGTILQDKWIFSGNPWFWVIWIDYRPNSSLGLHISNEKPIIESPWIKSCSFEKKQMLKGTGVLLEDPIIEKEVQRLIITLVTFIGLVKYDTEELSKAIEKWLSKWHYKKCWFKWPCHFLWASFALLIYCCVRER